MGITSDLRPRRVRSHPCGRRFRARGWGDGKLCRCGKLVGRRLGRSCPVGRGSLLGCTWFAERWSPFGRRLGRCGKLVGRGSLVGCTWFAGRGSLVGRRLVGCTWFVGRDWLTGAYLGSWV